MQSLLEQSYNTPQATSEALQTVIFTVQFGLLPKPSFIFWLQPFIELKYLGN